MSGVAASPASVDFRFLLEQVWGEPRDLKLSAEEMVARRDARVREIIRFAFERVPWYEGAYFLNEYVSWLLGVPAIVIALWGLVSLGAWGWRARRRPRDSQAATIVSTSRASRFAIPLVVCSTLLFAYFGFGFIAAGTRDMSRSQGMAFGMSAANILLLRSAWLLVLWAGIGALMRGFTDLFLALHVRSEKKHAAA